jgi:tetratricopeptide (TPR) repeat protein
MLRFALVVLALFRAAAPVLAQSTDKPKDIAAFTRLARDGYRLAKSDVEQLEATLATSPDDLVARTKLLGFYFRSALPDMGPEATIAARRQHILWLIGHHPESEAALLAEATIDAKGHKLADAAGYAQASAAWIEQAKNHDRDVAVLRHAARFFQLSDKDRAVSLLKQAQAAAPDDRDLAAMTGYVYALAILGVDMINQNGLPTSHNPAEAASDFARRAVDEVGRSSNVVVVGTAGQIIRQYGLMLSVLYGGAEKFKVDHVALAEKFLGKARDLDPANPHWQRQIEQLRKPF